MATMSKSKMPTNVNLQLLPGFMTVVWLALFFTGRCWPCNTEQDYVAPLVEGASVEPSE